MRDDNGDSSSPVVDALVLRAAEDIRNGTDPDQVRSELLTAALLDARFTATSLGDDGVVGLMLEDGTVHLIDIHDDNDVDDPAFLDALFDESAGDEVSARSARTGSGGLSPHALRPVADLSKQAQIDPNANSVRPFVTPGAPLAVLVSQTRGFNKIVSQMLNIIGYETVTIEPTLLRPEHYLEAFSTRGSLTGSAPPHVYYFFPKKSGVVFWTPKLSNTTPPNTEWILTDVPTELLSADLPRFEGLTVDELFTIGDLYKYYEIVPSSIQPLRSQVCITPKLFTDLADVSPGTLKNPIFFMNTRGFSQFDTRSVKTFKEAFFAMSEDAEYWSWGGVANISAFDRVKLAANFFKSVTGYMGAFSVKDVPITEESDPPMLNVANREALTMLFDRGLAAVSSGASFGVQFQDPELSLSQTTFAPAVRNIVVTKDKRMLIAGALPEDTVLTSLDGDVNSMPVELDEACSAATVPTPPVPQFTSALLNCYEVRWGDDVPQIMFPQIPGSMAFGQPLTLLEWEPSFTKITEVTDCVVGSGQSATPLTFTIDEEYKLKVWAFPGPGGPYSVNASDAASVIQTGAIVELDWTYEVTGDCTVQKQTDTLIIDDLDSAVAVITGAGGGQYNLVLSADDLEVDDSCDAIEESVVMLYPDITVGGEFDADSWEMKTTSSITVGGSGVNTSCTADIATSWTGSQSTPAVDRDTTPR